MTKPLGDVVYGETRSDVLDWIWRLSTGDGLYSGGVVRLAKDSGHSPTATQTALSKLKAEKAVIATYLGFNKVQYQAVVPLGQYEPEPPKERGKYTWTEQTLQKLDKLWADPSISAIEIGRQLGFGGDAKNAVVGMAHRRRLADRGNPVGKGAIKERSSEAPRPRVRSLPPLVSEAVSSVPKMEVVMTIPTRKASPTSKATEAKRVAEPSPFDNMIYRPPPVVPVQAFVPPSRKCQWPMWNDNEKPTHIYCDAPASIRSYCLVHARRAFTIIRRDAA